MNLGLKAKVLWRELLELHDFIQSISIDYRQFHVGFLKTADESRLLVDIRLIVDKHYPNYQDKLPHPDDRQLHVEFLKTADESQLLVDIRLIVDKHYPNY